MVAGYRFMNFNPFPIGTIIAWPTSEIPPGYLECDGNDYAVADYPELFALIGYTFGGADDLFETPFLRNTMIMGANGGWDVGVSGGSDMIYLTEGQLPSHHHTIPLTATTLAVEPGEVTVLTPVPVFTQDTGDTGSNEAIDAKPPFLALTYCIYAGRV